MMSAGALRRRNWQCTAAAHTRYAGREEGSQLLAGTHSTPKATAPMRPGIFVSTQQHTQTRPHPAQRRCTAARHSPAATPRHSTHLEPLQHRPPEKIFQGVGAVRGRGVGIVPLRQAGQAAASGAGGSKWCLAWLGGWGMGVGGGAGMRERPGGCQVRGQPRAVLFANTHIWPQKPGNQPGKQVRESSTCRKLLKTCMPACKPPAIQPPCPT